MKSVSILVPKGNVALSSVEGPFMIFNKVNDFLAQMQKPPLFKVQLVGMDTEPQTYQYFFKVQPDVSIKEVQRTDLIIIPATNGDMHEVIETNRVFIPWLQKQYQQGAELASLCVGAFLLASTGLLKNKQCSTHWIAANDFRKMFPEINLVSDKIITDEQGIYSSGGATSFYNLILYLVEKYAGHDMAVFCAKMFEIEIERSCQSPFMIFDGQKEHADEQVKRAQLFMEQNYREKITVDQLADMLALGRRSLERRFKQATANTVTEYLQRVKMEAAKKSLENSRKNINEVMYDVGYADTKAFRMVFKKITGLSPVDYRNKYNKATAML